MNIPFAVPDSGRRQRARSARLRWRDDLRERKSGETGFTLIELMVSVMILGSIVGVIGLVFTVSLRSTERVREMLPGPRAANAASLYLASDVSSAVPVDLASWLVTDPEVSSGCSGERVDTGSNVLRVQSRSAVDLSVTYVASYRFVGPSAGSTKGSLWRVFCQSGRQASSLTKIAEGIDPADPPVATVTDGNRSVEVLFHVWARESTPALVAACASGAAPLTVAPRCPYEVRVRAAVRAAERAPGVAESVGTSPPAVEPCQFVKSSIGEATRLGDEPGPLDAPLSVVIITNESNGASCRSLLVKVPAIAGAQCALSREGVDTWVGSCFGPESETVWPKSPSSFAALVFDRAYPGVVKADPPDPAIDIDVPGGDLTFAVATLLPPPAPTSLVVTPRDRSLRVSWTAPTLPPDTPAITGYVVTATPGTSSCTTTTATTCTLSGLTNGTVHSVTVRAVNRVGTGPGVSGIGRPWPPLAISGVVFEDVNYGGGAGRTRTAALTDGGVGRPGVRVELYGVTGSTATFLDATTTSGTGAYAFATPTCRTCAVRVVTSMVTSARAGSISTLRPVLTSSVSQSGIARTTRTDMVGGTNPSGNEGGVGATGTSFSTTTGAFGDGLTAQAFGLVDETIADGSEFDFGFNFDTVTNINDVGAGSLRQVVTNANTLGDDGSLAVNGRSNGSEHVIFMIPNGTAAAGLRSTNNAFVGGVATISPASELPPIANALTVDAQMQPGWTADPVVELDGTSAGSSSNGLVVSGSIVTIRELTINRFGADGLRITGSNARVEGNWIGLRRDGGGASGNGGVGISVSGATATIGGSSASSRNIISGNSTLGVGISGIGAVVQGNWVGTDRTGLVGVGNKDGIFVEPAATGSTIGGPTAATGNVITGSALPWTTYLNVGLRVSASGTTVSNNLIGLDAAGNAALSAPRYGLQLWANSTTVRSNTISGNGLGIWLTGDSNQLQGNRVGTNLAGTTLIGNTTEGGIGLTGRSSDNVIGGPAPADANVIAGNAPGYGVHIRAASASVVPVRNRVTRNSIYANGPGTGIDLVAGFDGSHVLGATPNDGATTATQPNLLMDSPVFGSVSRVGSSLAVAGYIGTARDQAVFANATVEVFVADDDSSGFGEGQTFLGSVTADSKGNFSGTIAVPTGVLLTVGTTKITGTATDGSGNTSEFGANRVLGSGMSGAAMWVDASDIDGDGNDANEPATNAAVNQLTDKSGNGRHFVSQAGNQPTLVTSATFAKRVLRFTPSQWMRQTAAFPAPSTVIYVARARTATSGRILQGIGNNWLLGWWNGRERVSYFDGWVQSIGRTPDLRPHVMSSVNRGPGFASDFAVDGVVVASNAGGVNGPNGLAVNSGLGGGETTDAEVAEIVVFPRALTPEERSTIENGLMDKWGTVVTTLSARTPVLQTATSGQPVPVAPQILTSRQVSGTPIAGVSVTFTATAGTVGGAASVTVISDTNGVATAPAWILTAAGCSNRLIATSPASADVVKFTATLGVCGTAYGVSGAAMWVDASDTDGDERASNEPAVNSPVLTLVDKSGFARDFESVDGRQPSLIASPSFSKNVLRFTPSQWMRQDTDFGAPSTVIYVARSRTSANGRILQGVANNWLLGWWNNLERVAYQDGWISYPGTATSQKPLIVSSVTPGGSLPTDITVNGVVVASSTGGRTGPNGLAVNTGSVGGGETTDAEVAEIIVFQRALTVTERSTVETALSTKWGVGLSVDLAATTPQSQSGSNGSPVAVAPKVRATGFGAIPVAGVSVTFTASAGGTVGGATTVTVTTGPDGIATAPSWIPNSAACSSRLTATSSISTDIVKFGVQTGTCPGPYGVTGAAMWVDASDTDADGNAGNEPAANAPVLALIDKSGNNLDFESAAGSEPTLVSSPAFANRVLRFTPTQWMRQSTNFGSPSTVIYVARSRTTAASRILQSVSNNWLLGWWGGGEERAHMDGWVQQTGVAPTTRARIMSAVSRGTSTEFAVDGVVSATNNGGLSGPAGLAVNSGRYPGEVTDSEVAEIVVFRRALTNSERLAVEIGLANKWGVALGRTLEPTTTLTPAGTPGAVVSAPPKVRLARVDGVPVVGVAVTFTVTRGGGTVGGSSSATSLTDTGGIATAPPWLLAAAAGYQELTVASSTARPTIVFTADTGSCPAYGVCSAPAMWVDASDVDADANVANEPAVGSSVQQLTDRSGNGRHFTSQTGSQPSLVASSAFAKPVLAFSPAQWMRQTYDFGSPSTVIYVARSRTTTSGRILTGVGNNWLLGWHGNREGVAFFQGWVANAGTGSTTTGRVMSAVIRAGAADSDFVMDGVLRAANVNGTAGPNGLAINNNGENTDAEVAEIVVFPKALSGAERYRVEAALATKWGLPFGNPVPAGVVASLDANRVSTMFTDSSGSAAVTGAGQTVCRWADLSSSANHAVQATSAQCPTYGVDATGGFVNFAANGSLRTVPTLSPDATVLVVAQSNVSPWNTWGWLASARGPNGFILHPSAGTNSVDFYPVNSSGSYTYVGSLAVPTMTGPTLYRMTMSGSNPVTGSYGVNGSSTAFSAAGVVRTAGAVPVWLGADDPGSPGTAGRRGNGRYREVLIYNRALTPTELTQVENYLRWKWGTA